MKRIIFLICCFVPVCSLVAQSHKYALQFELKDFSLSTLPSLIVVVGGKDKSILKEVSGKKMELWIDSIVDYPMNVRVLYYPDCTSEMRKDIEADRIPRPSASANLFITDAVNPVIVKRDTIFLLQQNILQKKYQQLQDDIMVRVNQFNERTGNQLHQAYMATESQQEKDSIERLHDNMFKINAGRPNLDSVIMPCIQNNLNNVISLHAMSSYITQCRFFKFDIPGQTFQSFLHSMPAQLRQLRFWKELDEITKVIKSGRSLIGQKAPAFINLKDSSGKVVQLEQLKGKIVFVDFWASWCAPCMAQVPQLKAAYQKVKNNTVEFVGISLDESVNSWKQAIRNSQLNWINLTDLKGTNGLTAIQYKALLIPYNLLIDKNGVVVKENIPIEALEKTIEELL
ncbi:TlpA family protein disulfide reductase [Pseudobacter ginsenosidimutans]|uniref:Thiol-disulfide isomerase/thioredoxin n=1 Tax=Pseudobacter ginsenosidimutans TaxID=661488 RepID=A0A4Q7MUL5_9BACT|nr:TlpA disulfide reductase family protein [Pseudobacter ginsenosidimutans]QEC40707.1 TlpA family protein disulfide reductase [Pseudobacter ginsenosidimutans]RZS72575.1 thiol-disulfide isomerase/thioredoxin [Pseudobacter ginsenosidimutans]